MNASNNSGKSMKKILFVFIIFLLNVSVYSQTFEEFKAEFASVFANKTFSEDDYTTFFETYYKFLNGGVLKPIKLQLPIPIVIADSLVKEEPIVYTLAEFKDDIVYRKNIDSLANSENEWHRTLAYATMSAVGDLSCERLLLNRFKAEKGVRLMDLILNTLLNIKSARTSEIIYAVASEPDMDKRVEKAYLFYPRFNRDSLVNTAYERMNDSNYKLKMFAILSLLYTNLTPKTDSVLRSAVREWPPMMRNLTIITLTRLKMGNLFELLSPYLEDPKLRTGIITALIFSPTPEDRQNVRDIISAGDSVKGMALETLWNSQYPENVRFMLKCLYTKIVPPYYFFKPEENDILLTDSLLPDVQNALKIVQNSSLKGSLLFCLRNRRDDVSTDLILTFLSDESVKVRQIATACLDSNSSPKIGSYLAVLLENPKTRGDLHGIIAVSNKIYGLNRIFEKIYDEETSENWKMICMDYFALFPTEQYKEKFKTILLQNSESLEVRASASLGLAKLQDWKSLDIIINAFETDFKEEQRITMSFQGYLEAFSILKNEKTLAIMQRFVNDRNSQIARLVKEYLEKW